MRTQRKRGGKVIVHLDVLAPGIPLPDGTVVVKVGDRERRVTVKKGTAVARFLGRPGRFRVRCQYAGGTLMEPGKARDWCGSRARAPCEGCLRPEQGAEREPTPDTEEPAGHL